MIRRISVDVDDEWNFAQPSGRMFDPAQASGIPEPARRYLENAIAAGTPLSSAVRLRTHGEIKLKGWYPFTTEEVICWERAMIWRRRGCAVYPSVAATSS